jgi:hypothetical protein
MPRTSGIRTGSDHSPSGSSAETSVCQPPSARFVVTNQNRPSEYRSVGAVMPPEPGAAETSSCEGRASTWPTCSQDSRSVERNSGTPGAYSKLDVTSQ